MRKRLAALNDCAIKEGGCNGHADLFQRFFRRRYGSIGGIRRVQRFADPIENSLFEFIFEKDFNNLEKDFALCLADDDAVSWWHRMVARQDYALQGWKRNRVYPDFIACLGDKRMLVLETKGLQLKGNEDTEYKRRLLDLLSEYHETAVAAGEINLKDGLSKSMTLTMLMEDDWREKYNKVKAKKAAA